MSLQQFLMILQGRLVLVLAVFGATIALIVAASLVLPKKYSATAAVVVDVKSPDPISGTMLHAMVMPGYMATQRDIITSDRVAEKAAQLLKVEARGLQKKLDVKPSRESNVIEISYSAPDAAFAAAAANAFAEAYIEASIELRVEPARQYARWFAEQDQTLRDNLQKAQARLAAHQQKYGIVASEERLDSEIARLNDLTAQLTVVQGQGAEANSKRLAGGAAAGLPEIVSNPLITSLKGDVARQEAKLQELAGNLGKNHPQYRRADAELVSLKSQLAAETRLIASGFGTAALASKEKQAELAAAVAAQKTKVLAIRQARDELAGLQRDLEVAQRAYEGVSQRLMQSKLESQVVQTNISILAPAHAPTEPSFPNLLLNTIAAIFLGTFGALGAAFTLELIDRRVRSAQDVAEMLQLPVLGAVPRRRRMPLLLLR